MLLIPAYTIKETDYVRSVIPNVSLGESLKHAFSNKHFRIVTLGQLLENTGMAFFQACIMYYVTSLMGLAETYSVLILAISIAGSLLMYPFVNKFAKKKGKKLPVILGCIVFSVAEVVICFCDLIPGNKLVLACVFALFVSFPFAVLNVLPSAMMADIIQYDTVTTGINQEGIFGAAKSFIVKMGNSLAIMIVPSLIVTGAAAGENVGVLGLKLTAIAGGLFCLLAVIVFLTYKEKDVLSTIEKGIALDAGAEDFSDADDSFEITTAPEDFDAVHKALEEQNIPMASAEVTMIPQTYVTLTDEADITNIGRILDFLDDDDDVQEVYHNWEE